MTWPSTRISPELIDSRPAMVLSRVDLPQPDGPTSTRKPPLSSVRSMPLRISSDPKRLRNASISRKAMASPFHRAGHKAAHEVATADDIDQQGGGSGDDRGRHVHVVLNDTGRGIHKIVERDRHRRLVTGREGRAEQEVVPNVGELVDHRDDEDRGRVGEQDAAKDLE